MYEELFCFSAEDECEDSAENDSCRKRDCGKKCGARRCAGSGVFDGTEHGTIAVCCNDAHDVGEYESEDGEEILQFFHKRLLSVTSEESL